MASPVIRQSNLLLRAALALTLVFWLVGPVLAVDAPRWKPELTPAETARLVLLQGIAAAYIFTLGAVLGSFLNVVIYRMPRGMNIVRPRSRCPACASPIAMTDNIPVLGWLRLGGKCRICGGPISPRYPLVEAAVGGILLLLCWLEVRLGGVNLPNWTVTPLDELTIISWRLPWGNLLLAAYHAWLLITLLVMLLIQYDGFRVPRVIVQGAAAVGLLVPLIWPWLRPVPALLTWPHLPGMTDGAAGAIVGLLLGWLIGWLIPAPERYAGSRMSIIAALFLIGSFLGWQAALQITIVVALPIVLTAQHVPPLLWPTLAACLYVPLWKQVAEWVSAIPFFKVMT